ncbi:MAG: molybdopterin-dependent oxidoreductase [Planctomycetes bacterium]|nr:molybdopterin-dependent oxidoreductase [Planctomycetota bacterium]
MKLVRRDFLKAAGLSGVGLALQGCGKTTPEPEPYSTLAGGTAETWIETACSLCAGSCGIRVRSIRGNAIKVEALPGDPPEYKGICPRAHAMLQLLYDPDRLDGPRVSYGRKGEPSWEPATWSEAVRRIAATMNDLRARGQAHSVVAIASSGTDLAATATRRFLSAYGSPNHVECVDGWVLAGRLAAHRLCGVWGDFVPDWSKVRFILSLGSPLLDASPHTHSFLSALGGFRRGREGERGKWIQAEARYSVSAAKADEWVPIVPGTEGVLALGLARSLLDSGQVAASEAMSPLRRHLANGYAAARVERIAGVPAGTVERLARALLEARSAVVLPPEGGPMTENSVSTVTAIHALNALIGAFGTRGPMRLVPAGEVFDLGPVTLDDVAKEGLAVPPILPGVGPAGEPCLPVSLLARASRPNVVLLLDAASLRSLAPVERNRLHAWLDRIPLVVSFSSYLDETASHADLVLPASTPLESWNVFRRIETGRAVLQRPAVAPFRDTRQPVEVLIDVARELGGTAAAAFPSGSWRDLVSRQVAAAFPGPRTDAVPNLAFAFPREFPAPPGEGRAEEGTLLLYPYGGIMDSRGIAANAPWLLESFGLLLRERWKPWAEIHPETAARLGIRDGDMARLESPHGAIRIRARFWEGIRPDVIAAPLGIGGSGCGQWSANRGDEVLALAGDERDADTGALATAGIRVQVTRG